MNKWQQTQSNVELIIAAMAAICMLPFILFSIGILATSTSVFENGVHIILLAYVIVMCTTSIYLAITIARDNDLVEYNKNKLKQVVILALYNISIFISPSIKGQLLQSAELVKEDKRRKLAAKKVSNLSISHHPGYVYIMRRSDGIYKLGMSLDTERRLKQHELDYGMGFELVARFVTPDVVEFEKLALSMTRNYEYKEQGRQELRRMTQKQLGDFIASFNSICEVSIRL